MMEHSLYISVGSIILSLFVVIFFIYSHFQRVILNNAYIDDLEKKLHLLEKSISETRELMSLEPLLKKELPKILGTKSAYLQMYSELDNVGFFPIVREYFQYFRDERVLENSEVFFEEMEDLFLKEKLQQILPQDIAFIFPIFSTSGFHIGNIILGKKISSEEFLPDEIEFLKEFSFFVEIHLKYIRTYTLMHEFSKILDEKVDNTTIAYNNLINRQKEFIKVISHEVRSPLTSAIFQVESAIENLEGTHFYKEKTLEELHELRDQLVRTGGLISKIFSVEYLDNDNVSLFREAIHFPKFLEYEIELFSRVHPDVTFLSRIDSTIGFVAIDKVQFQQVINNLLDNAIKFASAENPTVFLSACISGKGLTVTIEDNGKGFSKTSMEALFDKYNTGNNKNVGLGLGLYLCRKIITLHNGSIVPSNSGQYGGACFTITLPTAQNYLL